MHCYSKFVNTSFIYNGFCHPCFEWIIQNNFDVVTRTDLFANAIRGKKNIFRPLKIKIKLFKCNHSLPNLFLFLCFPHFSFNLFSHSILIQKLYQWFLSNNCPYRAVTKVFCRSRRAEPKYLTADAINFLPTFVSYNWGMWGGRTTNGTAAINSNQGVET